MITIANNTMRQQHSGTALFCIHALYPFISPPHLGHEPVSARVLLIFEDNICIIIRRQFFKALGVTSYFALGPPAGSQGLLGYVRAELLVG